MQLCVDLADDMIGGHTAQLQPIKMTNRSDVLPQLYMNYNTAQGYKCCTDLHNFFVTPLRKKKKKKNF